MPYIAPAQSVPSSSSQELLTRLRKGSISESSSHQDQISRNTDQSTDDDLQKQEEKPNSFLIVEDDPTPRPESVKTSPLDISPNSDTKESIEARSRSSMNTEELVSELSKTHLAEPKIITSPSELPVILTPSAPPQSIESFISQSKSVIEDVENTDRRSSDSSQNSTASSSSIESYPDPGFDTGNESDTLSSINSSTSGLDTPVTGNSFDSLTSASTNSEVDDDDIDREEFMNQDRQMNEDGKKRCEAASTSDFGNGRVRGVKGFYAWELTDELRRYKGGMYGYTHDLYLQAKQSTSRKSGRDRKLRSAEADLDETDKIDHIKIREKIKIRGGLENKAQTHHHENKDDVEKKRSNGNGHSQFGSRQSGMERLAAKKALARALNAC